MSGYCDIAPGHSLHGPYHDHEYGFPQREEAVLFERLLLEINQAGLSWETMLRKRDGFRAAYSGFEVDRVARYGERDRARLLADPGIIRNRRKIAAAVGNAAVFAAIRQEFGSFDSYLWQWTGGKTLVERGPTTSPLSDAISKDLKKRGMKFVGSTIIYAYLQAVGVLYAHEPGCFLEKKCP